MNRTIEGHQALIRQILTNQERLRTELDGYARQLENWQRSMQNP